MPRFRRLSLALATTCAALAVTATPSMAIVGGAGFATPSAYPPQAFEVYIGSNKPGQGEKVPVSKVTTSPDYLLTDGYDITILKLSRTSTKAPTPVSGAAEESAFAPSTLEQIVGF